jgi:hypothetical protein
VVTGSACAENEAVAGVARQDHVTPLARKRTRTQISLHEIRGSSERDGSYFYKDFLDTHGEMRHLEETVTECDMPG